VVGAGMNSRDERLDVDAPPALPSRPDPHTPSRYGGAHDRRRWASSGGQIGSLADERAIVQLSDHERCDITP
jgi:hypothetical protein